MALRVLIVEDNKDAADTLRFILAAKGHDVRVAYTGPDGVQQADAWRPSVILCDLGLPDFDGYAVADELQRLQVVPPALLIAITGYGSDADRDHCRDHGFTAHLTKPADPGELLGLLESFEGLDAP